MDEMYAKARSSHNVIFFYFFSHSFQAYVMYEKSLLDFQAEKMRLMQLSLKLDQKWGANQRLKDKVLTISQYSYKINGSNESQRQKTYLLICVESLLSVWRIFHPWLSKICAAKIFIRLRECAGWSEYSLGAHLWRYVFWLYGSNHSVNVTCRSIKLECDGLRLFAWPLLGIYHFIYTGITENIISWFKDTGYA